MLNAEQTLFYLRKAKAGDVGAKETLMNNNVLLIKSIVKRFIGKGVEYDDLYQLGCVGFLKAIKNFDEKFGVVFSTYAVPMIIGEIKRFLRDDGTIKVSRIIKSQAQTIKRYVQEKAQAAVNLRRLTRYASLLIWSAKTSYSLLTVRKYHCLCMKAWMTAAEKKA